MTFYLRIKKNLNILKEAVIEDTTNRDSVI
jgi:hypothetical protein